MSGLFDLEAIRHVDFVADDLKLTAERVAHLSPAWMPQSHPAPFITSVGDLESEEFKRQNQLISERWLESHRHDVLLDGYNHLTICDAFGTPEHPLFDSTCELIRSL
jgi:arylformamidase